jgi:surface polysaccharide O-acyltransferase-like enzyme
MEQPPLLESTPAPPVLEKKRFHDLDALRAFAMLLGIALHGAISFFPVGIWPAQDIHQPEVAVPAQLVETLGQAGLESPRSVNLYEMVMHAIHGFRLPLFFLVSGFFTAMLWRNRGLKQLAKHRAKRILLPLAIFVPIMWILLIPVGIYGGFKKEEVRKLRAQSAMVVQPETKLWAKEDTQTPTIDIGKAAGNGDLEAIERHIKAGTDLNQRGPDQSTPLMTATTFGRMEVAKALIEANADLDLKSKEGSTALLIASFFAHPEIVEALLEAGADPNIRNNDGATALDVAQMPWEQIKPTYDYVGAIMSPTGLKLDYERIRKTRPKIAAMLKEKGAEGGVGAGLGELVMLIFFAPIFHHLWFLYYLIWLVLGFIAITWLLGKLKWKALPDWVVTSPLRLLWLLPVTFLAQLLMKDSFGPATATGSLPWPPILIYYAIFFFFGAVCFGRDTFETKVGKLWPLSFVLAVPPLLAGLCLVKSQNNGLLLAACSVAYAWLMIFGFIGFFRAFFSGENPRIRYISDSSYWLYIMHLPVIMFVQAMISTWDMPSFPKFMIACAATTLPLLLIYEFVVRYTFIGTLLNGKRTREKSPV